MDFIPRTEDMKYFEISAFSDDVFKGNPAGVCILDKNLSNEQMQKIANQNNLSETAFLKQIDLENWKIQYFTPGAEVDLCGHASLASAHVLNKLVKIEEFIFHANKDLIEIKKINDLFQMKFPLWHGEKIIVEEFKDFNTYLARDLLVEFQNESAVLNFKMDHSSLLNLPGMGLIVTAPGQNHDFVSRCFYPKLNVFEDPVTGSAHSMLAPFWAAKLKMTQLKARQLSARGGELNCHVFNDNVLISGKAVTYLEADINIF